MRARLDRLVCRLRGHRRVRVIEKATLMDADSLLGFRFRVDAARVECSRCGLVLEASRG